MYRQILKLLLFPVISLVILVGPLWPVSVFAALERQPYLQSVSDTRVVLRWKTTTSTSSRVSYGASLGNLNTNVDAVGSGVNHEVVITGLTPNTKYFYSVGSTNGVIEAGNDVNHYFTTAPVVGSNQKIRVWAIGDPGTGITNQLTVRNAYYNLDAVETDVVLTLGDNAYDSGTENEYTNNFFNVYRDLIRHASVWATRGNHETNLSVHENAFTHPTQAEAGGFASGSELYYSFDYGNIHFVCLDSFTSSNLNGSAMYTWLESDLASTTQKWIIAYWHHPPYSRSSNHDSNSEVGQRVSRERANPILERYGVDLQLGGHNHFYSRTVLINNHYGLSSSYNPATHAIDAGNGRVDGDGVYQKGVNPEGAVYVLAGSSGKIGYTPVHHPANFTEAVVLGSMVIDVEGDRMDVRMLRETGAIQDYFSLTKAPLVNQAPSVDAGADQATQTDVGLNLQGSVSDDGLPIPSAVIINWGQLSGPGITSFANPNAANTTAGFTEVGVYVLQLSANDGEFETIDSVTITVDPPLPNQPPVVNAGADIDAAPINNSIPLNGSVADDGKPIPPATVTTTWSKVSGPGNVSFSDANSLNSNVIFSAGGAYVLRLTASDGELGAQDDINVTVVTEIVLAENTATGDKIDVKPGQSGAQSFRFGNAGDADYQITKSVIYLSRELQAPNDDFRFNIGTGINSGALANSLVSIPAANIDSSSGTSFTRYEITYNVPVGPLAAGVTYYMNFESNAANGKAYYLQYTVGNTYPDGTYFKNFTDDGKDIRFQISGATVGETPVNNPPVFNLDPFTKTAATEDNPYTSSIAADAGDPDGDALSFSKVSGPAWLVVAINGALSGTPGTADVGPNSFVVQVADPGNLNNTATLNINVGAAPPVNLAPAFTVDPISKPAATEGSAYTSSIAADASDPDGDAMIFSKVSGPAWLVVAPNGTLSGTPGTSDVGANNFIVQVTDLGSLSDTATLNINVEAAPPVNLAPAFTVDPISKPAATAGSAYASSLTTDAGDPDGDALSFSKVFGPAWLVVAINGALSGTPGTADVGPNSFVVQVTDPGNLSDTATLTINVEATPPVNLAPAFTVDPISKPAATEGSAYTSSIAADASDPDGDALSFSKVSGPTWLLVTADGTLSGTPGFDDIGLNEFVVEVMDAVGLSDRATLGITVAAAATVNHSPTFTRDPITKPGAIVGRAYQGNGLVTDATDPDGDALSFSKVSGPAWLRVAADGTLSGTPGAGDLGLNSFGVQVTDTDGLSASAMLNFSVSEAANPSRGSGAIGLIEIVLLLLTSLIAIAKNRGKF